MRRAHEQRMRAGSSAAEPRPIAAKRSAPLAAALLLASGCAVGPNYVNGRRPEDAGGVASPKRPWHRRPRPRHDAAVKGDWWTLFADPVLDGLVERGLLAGNCRA